MSVRSRSARRACSAAAVASFLAVVASTSSAQDTCTPAWVPTFGTHPGPVGGPVRAIETFDLGGGPALYVGGLFDSILGANTPRIARFDGATWSALGTLNANFVAALTTFDDGSGLALYAGGTIMSDGQGTPLGNVARWNGTQWSPLGAGVSGGAVTCFEVFDDGSGPALFVGGQFTHAAGQPSHGIAKWDGAQWSTLAGGLSNAVASMAVFDDGSGPALYVGGNFLSAGGMPALRLARWDGSAWSSVGADPNFNVAAMTTFDFGFGPELCVGGSFTEIAGQPVHRAARWNGSTWAQIGQGFGAPVDRFDIVTSGGAPTLLASGSFTEGSGPANHVARFEGGAWAPIGEGVTTQNASIAGVAAFQGELWLGGGFTVGSGAQGDHLLRWNGATWHAISGGVADFVRALHVHDDGSGPSLYVGGEFDTAGALTAKGVARWNGTTWTSLDSTNQAPRIHDFASYDEGAGLELFAAGDFIWIGGVMTADIARWDGQSWSAVGGGLGGSGLAMALEVHDDGTGEALYVAGQFQSAGGTPVQNIARWNGAAWSAVGAGVGPFNSVVEIDLAVFDDGNGPKLYAAGTIPSKVQRWDGTAWTAVANTIPGEIYTLEVVHDGQAERLHAGAKGVWKWRGTNWVPLGGEPGLDLVFDLHTSDVGGSPALYATGNFKFLGSVPANHIAKWDGTAWAPLDDGLGGLWFHTGRALATFDDGDGPALFVGGWFGTAGGQAESNLAKWACAAPAFESLPGCAANPEFLGATSPSFALGKPLDFVVTSSSFPTGWTVLFAGLDGTDANGCGFVLPGLGELLLGLAPTPIAIAQGPLAIGQSAFGLAAPTDPGLIGIDVAFQAATIGLFAPGTPVAMSNGLRATLAP